MADYHLNLGFDYSAFNYAGSTTLWPLALGVVSVSGNTYPGSNSTFFNLDANDTIEIWLYDLTKLSNPTYTFPNQATGTAPISPLPSNWLTFSPADSGTTGSGPFTVPGDLSWTSRGLGPAEPTWPSPNNTLYPVWTLAGTSFTVTNAGSWQYTVSIPVQLVNSGGGIANTTKTFYVDPEMIVDPI